MVQWLDMDDISGDDKQHNTDPVHVFNVEHDDDIDGAADEQNRETDPDKSIWSIRHKSDKSHDHTSDDV